MTSIRLEFSKIHSFVFVAIGLMCLLSCGSATRHPGEDADVQNDADIRNDADEDTDHTTDSDEDDECAAMDAREGPDTCDGGGFGYKWNGNECVYQGDLCNCIGDDCGSLFETAEACYQAFAHCIETDCGALSEDLVQAFEEAVTCDPSISSLQCDSTEMITDLCGCPWSANNRLPDQAQAAREAWTLYEAAECIPGTCAPCHEPTPTFRCAQLPIGTGGTCEILD